jgi:N-acetyl-alpha-D-glucosaminyl L-malate synthase BshA
VAGADQAVIVHASNFRPVKRVGMVFDVFRRVRAVRPARLILIGEGPDRAALQDEVSASPYAADVSFVGEVHDMVPWLSVADVFLLPSSQESFGLAALEAMACEVPPVVSRVGGLPEVISDGETGLLCDPQDPAGMAERTIALLADADTARRIGLAASMVVRERYCTAAVVPMYEQLYARCLHTTPG